MRVIVSAFVCWAVVVAATSALAQDDGLSDKELRQRVGWLMDQMDDMETRLLEQREHAESTTGEPNRRLAEPDPESVAACVDSSGATPVAPGAGTLDAAIQASAPGDVLVLEPGDYTHAGGQSVNLIRHDLTICGNGATLRPETPETPVAKGLLTLVWKDGGEPAAFDLHVEDVTFTGAWNTDRNGAGIRIQGDQRVTCVRCVFADSQSGILGGGAGGALTIRDGVFEHLGSDGFSHAIYWNGHGGTLTVEGSRFTDTLRGMHVKSLAARTVVRDSRFDDWTEAHAGDATNRASRHIEITHGGDALIEGNRFHKDPEAENVDVIFYALSRGGTEGSVTVRSNVAESAKPGARFIRNLTGAVVAADDNELSGFDGHGDGLISVDGGDARARIAGDPGVLLGTDGPDVLDSDERDASLYGFGGDDTIISRRGRALMVGGEGDDTLVAVAGRKVISAGPGDDRIELGIGSQATVSCGPGLDTVALPGAFAAVELNRRWDQSRWAVKVAGGFRHLLAMCERIEFTDGVFDIETETFEAR